MSISECDDLEFTEARERIVLEDTQDAVDKLCICALGILLLIQMFLFGEGVVGAVGWDTNS